MGEKNCSWLERTERLVGAEKLDRLGQARVAVFGVGGVGGYVAETLARAGVGCLDLYDGDTIALTNLNRQIIALHSTIGRGKAEVMRERILDINPDARVRAVKLFYLPENADQVELSQYDYVVDAIDTITAKLELAVRTSALGVPMISSMGTGNKLNPSGFLVADIYETSVCPLAKVMRRELKRRGVERLKVVYSREEPLRPAGSEPEEEPARRKAVPGSISFVPPAAGLVLAGEVIRDLMAEA